MNDDGMTAGELEINAKFALVWAKLAELGIGEIAVEFSGSGDSGQIDDVHVATVCAVTGSKYDDALYQQLSAAFSEATVEWSSTFVPVSLPLVALIEELSDPITTSQDDWWNNDGGKGTLRWIAADGEHPASLELSVDVARIEYDTYTYELDKFGEEE